MEKIARKERILKMMSFLFRYSLCVGVYTDLGNILMALLFHTEIPELNQDFVMFAKANFVKH